jgi:DNA-binding protein WhiA
VEGDRITAELSVHKDAGYHPHEQAAALIRTLFSRDAAVTLTSRGAHRYATVSFTFRKAAEHLSALASLPEEEAECDSIPRFLDFRCDGCSVHFLRGLFLSRGTVNDPAKSYHLELKLPPDGRGEPVRILFAEAGFELGVTARGGLTSLFCKSGTVIQELLAYIGATSSVFDFFNAQIERSIRNDENRATNCVTENINRAIRTGARHLTAIRYLDERDLLGTLPDDLQFTARLRLNNPDVTLAELAELHFPPITKSGVSHRLEKIMAVYEKYTHT